MNDAGKIYKFWDYVIQENLQSCPFTLEYINSEYFPAIFEKAVQEITEDTIEILFHEKHQLCNY